MTEQRPAPIDTPRYLLVLLGVVVLCSGVVASYTIGSAYEALRLPAVVLFAFPAVIHLTAAAEAWLTTRSADAHRRNGTKRRLGVLAVIMMAVGALANAARLERFDLPGMVLGGVVCGAGPLTLALVLFPARRTSDPTG